eukprot:354078-Chlamydomonas_euryale.AAC.3
MKGLVLPHHTKHSVGCNSTVRWTDGGAGRHARRAGGTGGGGPGGLMGAAGFSTSEKNCSTELGSAFLGRIIHFFTGGSPTRSMSSLWAVAGAVALCGRAAAVIGAPHCSH